MPTKITHEELIEWLHSNRLFVFDKIVSEIMDSLFSSKYKAIKLIGVPGDGKATLAHSIRDFMHSKGIEVNVFHEMGTEVWMAMANKDQMKNIKLSTT